MVNWFDYLLYALTLALVVGVFLGIREYERTKHQKFDVYTYPLSHKVFLAFYILLITVGLAFNIPTYDYDDIVDIIVTIICLVGLLPAFYWLLIICTTRITLVGTALQEQTVFTSKCISIDPSCTISKRGIRKKTYMIEDHRGNRIRLYQGLLGLENLVKEISATKEESK